MKLRLHAAALVLASVSTAPALADDRGSAAGIEGHLAPQILLGGLVSERDVGLLFDHMRAVMLATSEGRDPPPLPAEIGRRLDAAGGELRQRGAQLGVALTLVMERAVRDALRELVRPEARPSD